MATEPIIDPATGLPTASAGETTVTLPQEKLDDIINKAVGRATSSHKAATAAAEAKAAQLELELAEAKKIKPTTSSDGKRTVEELEAEIAETKRAGQGNVEALERQKQLLADKDREIQTAKEESLNIKRDVAITSAASKIDFVDLNVVAKLTKDNITTDPETGRYVIVGDNGQPRLNGQYEPMSLDEFYADYAAKNKYLVRSNVGTGTGQSTATSRSASGGKYEASEIFGKGSSSAKASELMKRDPLEYQRLRGVAVGLGLVAGR
jgi:hypothetical protein